MGLFDYTCPKCKGKKCGHKGHQFCSAHVVIRVPLKNNKIVHLKTYYEQYGYTIGKCTNGETYTFYLQEFEEYFKDWIKNEDEQTRSKIFVAECAYTCQNDLDGDDFYDYNDCCNTEEIDDFTPDLISQFIRVDGKMNLPTDEERYKQKLLSLRNEILRLTYQYNQVLKKFK